MKTEIINSRRNFLKKIGLGTAYLAVSSIPGQKMVFGDQAKQKKPNIILIMADDMGYTDLGCYGGEIDTPNIDKLAGEGIRLTQFYNAAKCNPTRASILTGLYHHQSTVRLEKCITIAEAMKPAGYATLMTGKWHLVGNPVERGFDKFFGFLGPATNYFGNSGANNNMRLGSEVYEIPKTGFYTTNAFTDYAIKFMEETVKDEKPFFLHVAHNAPHFPLQALPEDIDKYRGKFMKGWDYLRQQRYKGAVKAGVIKDNWDISPRDSEVPAWDSLDEKTKKDEDLKMVVYAAMIDCMDRNIGRLLASLEKLGQKENTLVIFLSDNGGCPYDYNRNLNIAPGPKESYRTYDTPWANVSNTPFRLYKRYSHEGGISTPFIASWPAVIKNAGTITEQTGHIIDIMATCIDVAGAKYPTEYGGHEVSPLVGKSLLPIFEGKKREGHTEGIYWNYRNHRAVRMGKWKLVARGEQEAWELFDMEADRTEMHNLAEEMPEKVKQMEEKYNAWVKLYNVSTKTTIKTDKTKRKKKKEKTQG